MVDEYSHHIDYGAGSGANTSLEDESDTEYPSEDDGRGDQETGFNPREAGNDHRTLREGRWWWKYEWLEQLNQGVWDTDRTEQNRDRGLQYDAEMCCEIANEAAREGGLEYDISPVEILDVLDTVENERDNGFMFGQIPVEVSLLAAITFVANRKGWWIRHEPSTEQGPLFDVLINVLSPKHNPIERSQIRHVRTEIREHLED